MAVGSASASLGLIVRASIVTLRRRHVDFFLVRMWNDEKSTISAVRFVECWRVVDGMDLEKTDTYICKRGLLDMCGVRIGTGQSVWGRRARKTPDL